MFRFNFMLLSLLSVSCALNVMTINMFKSDKATKDEEILKTSREIKSVNPDIVAVQSSWYDDATIFSTLLHSLGSGWSGGVHCSNNRLAVITKHKILGHSEHVSYGLNARIRLNNTGLEISFWSVTLAWESFSPEVIVDNLLKKETTVEKILLTEADGRVKNIVELLKHPEFVHQVKNSDNIPVVVAGVLNTPSHLDWTADTKDRHHGLVIDWPVTKLFTRAAGMTDSFREVHPDPTQYPGFTWGVRRSGSETYHYNERIDYIFYRGSLRPTHSYTVMRTTPISATDLKNRIGDKLAVVTQFELTAHKNENKPSFFIDHVFSANKFSMLANCIMKMLQ